MRRRALLAIGLGAASGSGLSSVAAAQGATVPLIGFLGSTAPAPEVVAPFLAGLAEAGYRDGRNVAVEYRWANNQLERLPELIAELLRLPLDVIVTSGGVPATRAAMAATSSVPIVFEVGRDPVQAGLVASFSRPGGNATGVHM
ncbi:MAG: ABC transporter substrate binding protein, partial [Burkholderiaceae bacterium]